MSVAFGFPVLQIEVLADWLSKEWDSPVYAFFKPTPMIEYVDCRKAHVFQCAAKGCHGVVHQFLDKGIAKLTSNLCQHAVHCWGAEAVTAAYNTRDLKVAREVLSLGKRIDGSITSAFQRVAKGKVVTYSHRQHTKAEAR